MYLALSMCSPQRYSYIESDFCGFTNHLKNNDIVCDILNSGFFFGQICLTNVARKNNSQKQNTIVSSSYPRSIRWGEHMRQLCDICLYKTTRHQLVMHQQSTQHRQQHMYQCLKRFKKPVYGQNEESMRQLCRNCVISKRRRIILRLTHVRDEPIIRVIPNQSCGQFDFSADFCKTFLLLVHL